MPLWKELSGDNQIQNPRLSNVREKHEQEYLTAVKMNAVFKRHYGFPLPDNEVDIIALYLHSFLFGNKGNEGRIAVLVLSHGGIAKEMVKVAHALLKVNHVYSLDMALTESPEDFLKRVLAFVKDLEMVKGILLLVDMGSLVTFREAIELQCGIQVEVIDRVDLVMVLEATRWTMLPESDLTQITSELRRSKSVVSEIKNMDCNQPMIITVCLSGVGSAEKIRMYIEDNLGEEKVIIKSLGMIDEPRLRQKVAQWQKKHNVIAIVGTINPEIKGITFIPFQTVASNLGLDYLRSLLRHEGVKQPQPMEIVSCDMIVVKAPWQNKSTVINGLSKILLQQGCVETGFEDSVLAREEYAPTCIGGGIAIPHTDPRYVVKPGIAIATLTKPIDWWGMKTDVIFLLALRMSDRHYLVKLLELFKDDNRMNCIRRARTPIEVLKAIILLEEN